MRVHRDMTLEYVLRKLHLYLDRSIYNTLGLYRDYRNFSIERVFVALVSVIGATFIRIALSPLLGDSQPFLLYLLSVILSTWLGGFRTGLLAMLASVSIGITLFVEQEAMLSRKDTALLTELCVFLLISAIMTILITALTRARRRTEFITKKLKTGQVRLDAANRQIKNILESISDGFVAFDRSWRFIYINQRLEKLFGTKRSALIGKNLWREFPFLRDSLLHEKGKEAEEKNRPVRFEYFSLSLNEWFLVHIYPSRDGFSAYFDEITEIKEREQRKDEFVSVASHELRTPVTSIKLFAQVLKEKFKKRGDTQAELYLEKMDHQLDKLTQLILSLLDVSQIHRGKLRFKLEEISLEELLREAVEDLSYISGGHVIELATEPASVVGDRERINQVVTNLIVNAIKYSPGEGRVVVLLEKKGHFAVVSVQDFGPGIPVEKQSMIFERFFQADDNERQTHSGLGLGLYISKEIIKHHGGALSVESEVGKGSTFTFTLPLAPLGVTQEQDA